MKKLAKILTLLTFLTCLTVGLERRENAGWPKPQNPLITVAPLREVLSFSVIGDPESDLDNLRKALEISREKAVEFTVIVGDLTSVGSRKELKEVKEILDDSQIKYFVIPGNHDLYSSNKLTQDPIKYFEEMFGDAYQLIEYPLKIQGQSFSNLELLLLNNAEEKYGIDSDQFDFVNSVLNERIIGHNLESAPLLIFVHKPLSHPTSKYLMGDQNESVSGQRLRLLKIVEQASVSAVFAGHLHQSAFYESRGVKMYVAGSVSSFRNQQLPRFLEIKLFENGEIKISEIEL